MERNEVINHISKITNIDIDAEEFNLLKTSIIRRLDALFTKGEVQDEYKNKFYLSIVYKYFMNKGDHEKANKYAQLLADTIIKNFVLGDE
jgi:hypothetical protein